MVEEIRIGYIKVASNERLFVHHNENNKKAKEQKRQRTKLAFLVVYHEKKGKRIFCLRRFSLNQKIQLYTSIYSPMLC